MMVITPQNPIYKMCKKKRELWKIMKIPNIKRSLINQ